MLNMEFKHIEIPKEGEKIQFDASGNLIIPDNPIIPFIEGDGIGSDILFKVPKGKIDFAKASDLTE